MTVMPGASRIVSPTNGPNACAATDPTLKCPHPQPLSCAQGEGSSYPASPSPTVGTSAQPMFAPRSGSAQPMFAPRSGGGGASFAASSQRDQLGPAFEGAQTHQEDSA